MPLATEQTDLQPGGTTVAGATVSSYRWVIIAALVGFAVTRRSRLHGPSFILGVGVGLVPFFLLNHYVYGNLFGPQVTINVAAPPSTSIQ